jgi:hypothetical protein
MIFHIDRLAKFLLGCTGLLENKDVVCSETLPVRAMQKRAIDTAIAVLSRSPSNTTKNIESKRLKAGNMKHIKYKLPCLET